MKTQTYIDKHIPSLKGKTYIITGANSGIGFQAASILLDKGARVIFACRNEKRALNAINKLNESVRHNAIFIHYDQSDFQSIDAFLVQISENYSDFDGILLNAGILKPKQETYTKQGFKSVIGTNYLGVMYLLEKLNSLELSNKKIVLQSSLMARRGKYKKGELNTSPSHKFHAYNISKMGVDLLFLKYSTSKDRKHDYYLCEPGACYSNIYNSFPKILLPLANGFMKLFFHSAKKGCLSGVRLLTGSYENGSYLFPRGLFAFSGFPKMGKVSHKIKKSRDILRDGEELIKSYL